jgi:hypothetical protein
MWLKTPCAGKECWRRNGDIIVCNDAVCQAVFLMHLYLTSLHSTLSHLPRDREDGRYVLSWYTLPQTCYSWSGCTCHMAKLLRLLKTQRSSHRRSLVVPNQSCYSRVRYVKYSFLPSLNPQETSTSRGHLALVLRFLVGANRTTGIINIAQHVFRRSQ